MHRRIGLLTIATMAALSAAAQAQNLDGYADMHTHPMSHLAFGGMVVFGAPDPGSLMLAGQRYRGWHWGEKNCWLSNGPAETVEVALGFDNQVHGAPGFGTGTFGDANNCGDLLRSAIVDKLEEKYIHEAPNGGLAGVINDHPHHGYPDFRHWPHWSSVTHQQMYWEWIRRAHGGGLRVMVALAVNNTLLAKATNASQFLDDESSVRLQIEEIKKLVDRHHPARGGFMEIATSPEDLRRIVGAGHLAVVLGVETDDFGNLAKRAAAGEVITQAKVDAEIHELHGLGVRYLIPLHFSNTVLGGYAITRDLFALSSREYTNLHPQVRQSCGEGIHFELRPAAFSDPERHALRTRDLGRIIDTQPERSAPSAGCGHANVLGLSPVGAGALRTMMNLGFLIDIDHMSRLAAEAALGIANERSYPLNTGHNGPSGPDCQGAAPANEQACHENVRTPRQYEAVRRLGGMVGLGHGGTATNFVRTYRRVLDLLGNRPIAIGTDVNGLEALPAPDPEARVTYSASFPRYRFGNRTWDINSVRAADGREVGDGVAHYGLMPDWIRSWQASRNPETRMTARGMEAFMGSAEGFARTWERAARRRVGAPQTANLDRPATWCSPKGVLLAGDFDGDGAADLLCQDATRLAIDHADARGALAGLADFTVASTWCTHAGATLHLGDFNGDGRMDLLCRDPGRLWFNHADRQGRFAAGGTGVLDTRWCTQANATIRLGDVNGDGRTDLLCKDPARLAVIHADRSGRFRASSDWQVDTRWCTHGRTQLHQGDFNGDGRMDLLCKDPGRLWFNLADGEGRYHPGGTGTLDTAMCTQAGASLHVADVNGDGRSDLLCRDPGRLGITYAGDSGQFSGRPDWHRDTRWCNEPQARLLIADLNGDARQDLLCRTPTTLQIDYASIGPAPAEMGRFER
jgi:hypothetical protein